MENGKIRPRADPIITVINHYCSSSEPLLQFCVSFFQLTLLLLMFRFLTIEAYKVDVACSSFSAITCIVIVQTAIVTV